MSIIHTYISTSEVKRLSLVDRDYLKRRIEVNCMLNNLLHRPINRPLLTELRCVLDKEPIVRQNTEQYIRNSKVNVYKNGRLIRIEHANGKVARLIERGKQIC